MASIYLQYRNPLSEYSDFEEDSMKTVLMQHEELFQDKMSSTSKVPISMKELVEQFKQIHIEIIAVKNKNDELHAQLNTSKLPSPTISKENNANLQALIKALTVQSEEKAKVPDPHE